MITALMPLLRHLSGALAGYLVAQGVIDEQSAMELAGGLAVLAVTAWSYGEKWYNKRQEAQKIKDAIDAVTVSQSADLSRERLRANGQLRDL